MPYIENLKDARLSLRLSQAKLAGRADVDRVTLARCENGYFIQDVPCTKIADALRTCGFTGTIQIADGGKSGEMPKKGSRRNVGESKIDDT